MKPYGLDRRVMMQASTAALAATVVAQRLPAAPAAPNSGGNEAARGAAMSARAPRFGDARDWWFERRFGMFVHWGLYAIHGWHEQEQWRRRVPRSEYVKLQAQWNPVKFDPDAWLDVAEQTGMQYICLTTKHHDGFCLWDTAQTDYSTMHSPYGKDVVGQLAEACHKRRFPLCLYYSIADWHHPNYPNQGRHHELPAQPGDDPKWDTYLEFLTAQIRELCSNYGTIHGVWWDMNVPQHRDPSINAMIRRLQPAAVINNRGFDDGDFGTPERDYTTEGDGRAPFATRVEACQSVGRQSWGYRADEDYYSDRHLMRSIAKFRARDANYLLNIGPLPDGALPAEATAILARVGGWYQRVAPAFDARPCSRLTSNGDVLLTRQDDALYVVLANDPTVEAVQLPPLMSAPESATLLNDGRRLECVVDMVPTDHESQRAYLRIKKLPINALANEVLVARLDFAAGMLPPEDGA
jgi:alpha-L-fucosidase